jgi:hypothetical protein
MTRRATSARPYLTDASSKGEDADKPAPVAAKAGAGAAAGSASDSSDGSDSDSEGDSDGSPAKVAPLSRRERELMVQDELLRGKAAAEAARHILVRWCRLTL